MNQTRDFYPYIARTRLTSQADVRDGNGSLVQDSSAQEVVVVDEASSHCCQVTSD
jgi:hypothetical protein